MQTITITAYRRPHYFEELLKSLVTNDLDGWVIHIFVESSPVQSEFRTIAEAMLDGHRWHIHFNDRRLGVKRNPFQAQRYVFEKGSELNLYLEEDLLLAPDVTRLARWYGTNKSDDEVCLNLVAGGCVSSGMLSHSNHAEVLVTTRVFNSLGFVVSAAQWERHFEPHWFDFPFGMFSPTGGRLADWDCAIYAYVMSRSELRVVQPVEARARHIGREDGENCGGNFHDQAFSDLYLSATASKTLNYRKCENWMELPHPVRSHLGLWQEMAGQQRMGRKFARVVLWPLGPVYRVKAAYRSWRAMRR